MTLADIRVNIDRVDKQIRQCFCERMELADQVAQVKAETGDSIFKPDREDSMISRLSAEAPPEIRHEYIAMLKRIIEVSRKYQYSRTLELRDCFDVKWLTEEKPLHNVAMLKQEFYICDMVSKDLVTTYDNFEQIGKLIEDGSMDGGIGILENVGISTNDEIHSMLKKHHLYINRCEMAEDSGVRRKVVLFTPDLVVRPEDNRVKMMFVCQNQSGSLAGVLAMISDYDFNLTEIHSKPDQEEEWNYEFYIEMEGNILQKEMQALIFQLENETQYFRILGSYSCKGDFQ